jgi:outer membrane protein assembly factor BamB
MMGLRKPTLLAIILALAMSLAPALSAAQAQGNINYDWLQFNGGPTHSGANYDEFYINPASVTKLSVLYQVKLPSPADSPPVFLRRVTTAQGNQDLLFINTFDGQLLALDAITGDIVWSQTHGPNGCIMNSLSNPQSTSPCFTTSGPAIDPNRQYIYVYGLDGYVHKHRVTDGVEITGNGWPELATRKTVDEKGSSNLSIATAKDGTSYLYVTNSGYPSDMGDYQGHLTTINLTTGEQKVFNVLCSDQAVHFYDALGPAPNTPDCSEVQAGVWGRSGAVYDPATDKVYITSGNGSYDPQNHYWGDSLLALNPDGSGLNGDPLDSYTPTDYAQLQNDDMDLGATTLAILPPLPGSSIAHVGVQGGKDAILRLVNLDDLSGQGGPGHTGGEIGSLALPGGPEMNSTPVVWTDPQDGNIWLFATSANGLFALRVSVDPASHLPVLSLVWSSPNPGNSPLVANGVLFYEGNPSSYRGEVYALDAATGESLWSYQMPQDRYFHWGTPVVADGVLYTIDYGNYVTAFVPPPLDNHVYLPAVGR